MKRLLLSAAFALALGTGALAHAHLEMASPEVGGTVPPPKEISIVFSEGVDPKLSGISVSGPGGDVPLGPATSAPDYNKALVVKVRRKLDPGTYKVKWHAVSVDTHRTQGDFEFTVK